MRVWGPCRIRGSFWLLPTDTLFPIHIYAHPQLLILRPVLESIGALEFPCPGARDHRTHASRRGSPVLPISLSQRVDSKSDRPVTDNDTAACRNKKRRSPVSRRGISQLRCHPSTHQPQSRPNRRRRRKRRPPGQHTVCTTKWKMTRTLVFSVSRQPHLVPPRNQTQSCLAPLAPPSVVDLLEQTRSRASTTSASSSTKRAGTRVPSPGWIHTKQMEDAPRWSSFPLPAR